MRRPVLCPCISGLETPGRSILRSCGRAAFGRCCGMCARIRCSPSASRRSSRSRCIRSQHDWGRSSEAAERNHRSSALGCGSDSGMAHRSAESQVNSEHRQYPALTRKSSGSSCRICLISRLWRTLQRAVVAFMPPLAGRRDESRRGTLKRAPQRCVETRPTFIPMGGQTGHGDSLTVAAPFRDFLSVPE